MGNDPCFDFQWITHRRSPRKLSSLNQYLIPLFTTPEAIEVMPLDRP
jgi:hypothetical protein